jgi:2'-5' RNA ligase
MPSELADAFDRMCRGLPHASWVAPEDMHLTLSFLGSVDDGTFVDFGERLTSVRQSPFDLELRGLGHFPPRGPVRQLWVGGCGGLGLDRLRRSVNACATDVGIPIGRRKFVPHVTIARFGTPPEEVRLASYLLRHSLVRMPPFPVSEFYLYSSFPSRDGTEHVLEAEYDFVAGTMTRQ